MEMDSYNRPQTAEYHRPEKDNYNSLQMVDYGRPGRVEYNNVQTGDYHSPVNPPDYHRPPSRDHNIPRMDDYNWTDNAPASEHDNEEDVEEEEEEEEEEVTPRPAEPSMLRVVLNECLTNGGLILFLICYTCMGAAVFQRLEGPAEENAVIQSREINLRFRNTFLYKMKNISHWADLDEDQWWRRASRHLKGYEDELGVEVIAYDTFESSWGFYNSLFFATTILTTIGYGNIAPVTVGGRVFCMVYAVFGIALLLLVLASIGTLLARGATLTYRRMHTMIQSARGDEQDEEVYVRDRRSQEIIDEIWTPPADKTKGAEMSSMHVVDLQGDGEKNGGSGGTSNQQHTRKDEEPPKLEEPQIPLWVVLVFAFLYICFLALLLQFWEDQWDYFEAFYFSFITLTTIGFGDLVPMHQKNLLACTFFILLGMAIISMCIALAQELIIQKVSWLSRKIGVAFASQKEKAKKEGS